MMVGIFYEMILFIKEEKKYVMWCLVIIDIIDFLKLFVNLICFSIRLKNLFCNVCFFYVNFIFRKIYEKGKEFLDFSIFGNLIIYLFNVNVC